MSAAQRFRKKPVEIEAIRFTGDHGANWDDVYEFVGGTAWFAPVDPDDRTDDPDIVAQVFDKLHSTWVGVKAGQWVLRGVQGEFYPCDAEVFESTYEPVN